MSDISMSKAEEFWKNDYSQRKRQILSDYNDKMNFAEAYADKHHQAKLDDGIKVAEHDMRYKLKFNDSPMERLEKQISLAVIIKTLKQLKTK